MLAVIALVQAFAAGLGFYGSTIYVSALTEGDRQFSILVVSVSTGGFMLVSGIGGLLVARVMTRVGPRLVVAGGAVVQASALSLLGQATADATLLLAFGAMGIGFAALTVVPAGHLVTAWFPQRRRAVAMSVAFMGLPIGGVVGTPIISHLVGSVGFSAATAWLALALVVVVLPAATLLREPDAVRRVGDGSAQSTEGSPAAEEPARAAIRSSWFALVSGAFALAMISQIGVLTHLYSAVVQVQDATTAAATISTVTFASLLGRVAGSWALSHFGLLRSTCTLATAQAVALVGIVAWRDHTALVAAAALLGLTVGNLQVAQPLLLADRFGPVGFSRILAASNLCTTVGMSLGPLIVGAGVNAGLGYGASFLTLAACSLAAAGLVAAAGMRDRLTPDH